MIDANAEIERLRQRLRFKNLGDKLIDEICNEVSIEISSRTSDILADAMNEAVNAGGDAMSIDFIDEIKAVRSGSSFDIITESGKTDFSEPPFPMLPTLLQNAKVAKDGSLYKVIPIKQKSMFKDTNDVGATTEAAFANIEAARRRAKQSQEDSRNVGSAPDSMKGMDTFSALQTISKSRRKNVKMKKGNLEPAVDFRTASSKQDASTQWVNPGRNIDMGGTLNDINDRLHDSIDRTIEDVIRMYEDMY